MVLHAGLAVSQETLPRLTIKGENFVTADGRPVRFWGTNLVALYPDSAQADTLAADLAAHQINLVRPHHLLRPSKDWSPQMESGALVLYNKGNSREFDPVALDRFDYLMSALKRHGIYIALSTHFSRQFRPDDVDILKTDDQDRKAWREAMNEVNTESDWRVYFDFYKTLPVIDERAALLSIEFATKLFSHVNPYTGLAYGKENQVLTLEVLNEASFEYFAVCHGKVPDYWRDKLLNKWKDYAASEGFTPGDFFKPADATLVAARAQFIRQLETDYFNRIKAAVRATGSQVPMSYSNLWRGDNSLAMHSNTADFIEDHTYMDPFIVRQAKDGFAGLSRSALVGKPYFIGEFNQAEGANNIKEQSSFRTMLMPAVAAYASFYNWTGVEWFAWLHGDQALDKAGRAVEGRASSLGNMINDGMMIDHLRTAGLIFRRQLVAPSRQPITLQIKDPFATNNYHELMDGKLKLQPGWQSLHAIRKQFVTAFPGDQDPQKDAAWLTTPAAEPLISDTGELTKDTARKQFTVAAPQAEAFSGYLDKQAPAGLRHLALDGSHFATVILVADDGKKLPDSQRLIISRTGLDADLQEINGPDLKLTGLQKPTDGRNWHLTPTRPPAPAKPLTPAPDGTLALPADTGWHEAELQLR
jgi:hypothetical protein